LAAQEVANRHIRTTDTEGSRIVNQALRIVLFDTEGERDSATGLYPLAAVIENLQGCYASGRTSAEEATETDVMTAVASQSDFKSDSTGIGRSNRSVQKNKKSTIGEVSIMVLKPPLLCVSIVLAVIAIILILKRRIKSKN
jgi:hypothetical protein